MRRAAVHILTALTVLIAMSGCTKYTSDCHVVIKPRIIRVQSSPTDGEAAFMVRAYTYYLPEDEIEDWTPEDYAKADAGIIRNKKTGEERSHDFMGEQSDNDTYIHFTLSRSPVLLVAVDPINKFYAYRELEIPVPMESLYTTLRIMLWRSENEYKELQWIVVNGSEEGEGEVPERDRRPGIQVPDDDRKAEGNER